MGTKTIKTLSCNFFFASATAFFVQCLNAELIEINRVVAKVNDRIVTWGEIDNAMTRLNFSDQEKKTHLEFVEKIDRLLSRFQGKRHGDSRNLRGTRIQQAPRFGISTGPEAFPRLPAEQWTFAIGVQKRPGRRNHLQSHAFDSQEAQGGNQPRESRGVLRKHTNLFKTEEKIRLGEIAFSQIAGEPPVVLLQQARKVVEEFKKGVPFKSLPPKTAKARSGIKQGTGA